MLSVLVTDSLGYRLGLHNYCETAIAVDRTAGFKVDVVGFALDKTAFRHWLATGAKKGVRGMKAKKGKASRA